jgi:1-acyl-sn-glycerol-3-phosphate acyltransferase
LRPLFKLLFKLTGWKIQGQLPADLKKYIIIFAPHSTNWDFIVGVAARSILRLNSKYLGKYELFRPPYGWIFRALGGYPVYRDKSHDLVDQVAEMFRTHEHFILALAPEGSRAAVPRWKTGFYWIAVEAKVPIEMVTVDYPTKTITLSKPFYPSGDLEADAPKIEAFFKGKRGLYREIGRIL